MKESVIFCGDYRRDYTLREQLAAVCEEMEDLRTGLVFGIDGLTNYDFIEEALTEAIESGVDRVTILHENDSRFDAFEAAVLREYGEAFNRIDVLPKRSSRKVEESRSFDAPGRSNLFEDSTVRTAPQTAPVEEPKKEADKNFSYNYVVFPFNAQVKGTFAALKSFKGTPFKLLSSGEAKPMIYQPEQLRTVCYQMAPEVSLRHFASGDGLASILSRGGMVKVSDEEAFLVQLRAEVLAETKANLDPRRITFYYPKSLDIQKLEKVFGKKGIPFDCGAPDTKMSADLYKIAAPIMADFNSNKIKFDQNRVDAVLGKEKTSSNNQHYNRVQHAAFLIREVHNNQKLWRKTNVSGKTRKQQIADVVKSFYSKFGIDKDVATMKHNLEAGGAGLAVSAIGFLADVGKKIVDKKEDKSYKTKDEKDASDLKLLISHQSFTDVLELIDNDDSAFSNDFVRAQA